MNYTSLTDEKTMKEIQKLMKEGKVKEAKVKLEEIVEYDQKNTEALHLLGIINAQTGNPKEGIKLLQKVIDIEPDKAETFCDLATVMQSMGNKNSAADYYKKAIDINPKMFQAHYNLGNINAERGKIEESINAYKKAIEINPKFSPAYNNLGNVLKAGRRVAEALYMYQHAILVDPNYIPAYNNVGLILQDQGKSDEAIQIFEKALAMNPNFLEVSINLANAYKSKRRYSDAIELYKKVVKNNPKYAYAYNNLGLTYQEMGKNELALYYYKQALKIAPEFADVLSNMGSLHQKMGKLTEALKYYEQAIEKRPNYSQALFNVSTIHFLKGEYEKAWKYHEARLGFPDAVEREQRYLSVRKVPKWKGESLSGKTIFVYSEQGFGDSIQFSRYLPLLKSEKGASKVLFRPQSTLEELFRGSDLDTEVLDPYLEKDKFVYDFYIPLLSLPYHFKTTTQNVPKTKRYLKAKSEKVEEYKGKYFRNEKFKIGIAWQGFWHHSGDLQRSISLKMFLPVFLGSTQIYSLQKGPGEDQLLGLPDSYGAVELGKTFKDFFDTAAAIENLDLVIAVDTAVAHLAAALGKKTWILLPPIPDWRWRLEGSKSVWYDSVRLFRKKEEGSWKDLFEEVASALKEIL
jgi:tetratricopeptide (TPR) repeat protein